MKIIITGAGSVGSALARNLVEEKHEVTVIDPRQENLDELSRQFDLRTVCGKPCYPDVLFEAGAGDAELVAAVSANDEENILACQIASARFGVPNKIARVKAESYAEEKENLFTLQAIETKREADQKFDDASKRASTIRKILKRKIDIQEVISPERLVADEIAKLVEFPGCKGLYDFPDMRVTLVQVIACYGGSLVGNPLAETIQSEFSSGHVNIVGLYRRGKAISITPNTVINAGDEVYLVADTSRVREAMSLLQRLENPYRQIMIYGGGTIGASLARKLENRYRVKLIETDRESAERLAQDLEKTMVLHAEHSVNDVFQEEGIDNVDLFIAVSRRDEDNITTAMLAKQSGARKTVATIQKKEYFGICEANNNVDISVVPQFSTLSALLTFIRHADIKCVHSVRMGLSEAMEIVIHGDPGTSDVIGKSVKEIKSKLPQGTVIGAICHLGTVYVDCSNVVIENGDRIVVFMGSKHIKEIERLFAPGAMY